MASPTASAPHDGHSLGFNLGLITLAVCMAGLAIAYGIDAAGRSERFALSGTLERTLGATKLNVPAAWLREDTERSEGFAKQVELTLSLPLGVKAASRSIHVTLLPRSRARPSASLLDGVYLHQFGPEQLNGPPGLIGKPLEPREGFANETVWYDALSSTPFVAKCIDPIAEGAQGQCLRTVYLGPGIAAVYSFDEDVLQNWRQFDAQIEPLLQQVGAL